MRVRVGNISPHGALIAGEILPMQDEQIVFRCNSCTVRGRVAWVEGRVAGIQFEEDVGLDELLRAVPQHSQMVVKDTRTVNFRRPGLRENHLTDEEQQAVDAWLGRPSPGR